MIIMANTAKIMIQSKGLMFINIRIPAKQFSNVNVYIEVLTQYLLWCYTSPGYFPLAY